MRRFKWTLSDLAFHACNFMFLALLGIITLLPFMNVLSKAVSEEWAVVSGKVGLLPVGFQLGTLGYVAASGQFLRSFGVSVLVASVGTAGAILMTALAAYPLSKRRLPGMRTVLVFYVFTMVFSGGLIPNYLLIKRLGLINTLGALILPSLISVYNMLIVKNYFESLPESLEESAHLDGASPLHIFFSIMLPLSIPVIATVSLFYMVAFWNDFFNPMIYINSPSLKTLQLYLRDIVMDANASPADRSADDLMNISPEGVRAATIIASTVPILLVYPWVQRYFIKGILIGSVKG